MTEPVVAATGLTKRFGALTALADVSISASPGSVVAVLGPNGAGKSTLLRILAGLAKPSAGEVRYAGGVDRRAARGHVGYIGHATFLYPALSARENEPALRSAAASSASSASSASTRSRGRATP